MKSRNKVTTNSLAPLFLLRPTVPQTTADRQGAFFRLLELVAKRSDFVYAHR
jgi:hypothetical protein